VLSESPFSAETLREQLRREHARAERELTRLGKAPDAWRALRADKETVIAALGQEWTERAPPEQYRELDGAAGDLRVSNFRLAAAPTADTEAYLWAEIAEETSLDLASDDELELRLERAKTLRLRIQWLLKWMDEKGSGAQKARRLQRAQLNQACRQAFEEIVRRADQETRKRTPALDVVLKRSPKGKGFAVIEHAAALASKPKLQGVSRVSAGPDLNSLCFHLDGRAKPIVKRFATLSSWYVPPKKSK
jgi:hypothetical protein